MILSLSFSRILVELSLKPVHPSPNLEKYGNVQYCPERALSLENVRHEFHHPVPTCF